MGLFSKISSTVEERLQERGMDAPINICIVLALRTNVMGPRDKKSIIKQVTEPYRFYLASSGAEHKTDENSPLIYTALTGRQMQELANDYLLSKNIHVILTTSNYLYYI